MRYGKSKLREGVTRITDGIVNEFLMPTFTTADVYFKLVDDIVTATFEKYPKTKKLQPFIDRFIMTKKVIRAC